MYTILRVSPNPHVSYLAPGIHQMNARSQDTLVLNTVEVGLLKTAGMLKKTEINSTVIKRIVLFNSAVDEIFLKENQKVSAEKESQENIESGFYQNELCQINNTSLKYTKESLNGKSLRFNAN